ncbi:MFS transporter, partial [Mycobacterium rufum]|nr:MFS transporter [Mycolicibacterium rufum]
LYGATLNRGIPYFPDLVAPLVVGGFGIGVISVILPLCAVADVGPREIGPVSSITLMVQNLGGPVVLVVIQAVQTSRTLFLGG